MSESPEERSRAGKDAPTHFIVEVEHKGRVAYALCARVLLVEGEEILGIPTRRIRDFLDGEQRVRAAPVPEGTRLSSAMGGRVGMTGVSLEVSGDNATIHIAAPRTPDHDF